jgi:hypothetical protein
MSRMWVGATGAAFFHEEIRTRWMTPFHQDWMQGWIESKSKDDDTTEQEVDVSAWMWTANQLPKAPIYALEETAAALVQHGIETWHDQPILATDLPTPAGLVLCEYPLTILDRRGKEFPMPAFAWAPGRGRYMDEVRDGVLLYEMTSNEDMLPHWNKFADVMPPTTVLGYNFLPYGTVPSRLKFVARGEPVADEVYHSQLNHIHYVQAFWAFVQQKVLLASNVDHPRAVRKRAARAEVVLPTLNVVRLRRAAYVQRSDQPAGMHPVDWRYRWIVRGHWRMQPYPSIDDYKQIWIDPYVKGPEDKPLIKRKTIMDVAR